MRIEAKSFKVGNAKAIIIKKTIIDMINMKLVEIIRNEDEIIVKKSNRNCIKSKKLTKLGNSKGILFNRFDNIKDEKVLIIEVLEDRLIIKKKEKK